MTTALVGVYVIIGLVIARLIISAQPDESTRGLPAFAAATLIVLLWPLVIGAAALMTVVTLLTRKRDKD